MLTFPASVSAPAPPPDLAARVEALDTTRSFVVEAPAGSGKTGLLIQRYLKLLADPGVTSSEQVLALTFTTKATAEMRDRVLTQLQAARNGTSAETPFAAETRLLAEAVLTRDSQLSWDILAQPNRLNIRTIDSVCAEIARALPVLSGSGGSLAPAPNAQPLYREAARRTLLLLGSGGPEFDAALRELLLHRDANLADCESLLAEMLGLRDQWGELIPLARPHLDDTFLDSTVLPQLERALDQAICAGLTRLAESIPPSFLTAVTALAADLSHLSDRDGSASPIALCAGRYGSPEARAEHLDHWRALIHLLVTPSTGDWRKSFAVTTMGFDSNKQQKAQLKQLIDEVRHDSTLLAALCHARTLPPATYPLEQWAVAKSLFRVLSRALVELQLVFSQHSQCDFTELSLLARQALRDEAGVHDLSNALGAGLQHLLVDEMQDTSTSQYELIQLLTQRWDGYSQTVFLVGDPRQSIYLFRQARVERFVRTMHTGHLGDLPLTRLRLTANFRSQRTLVEHFNRDFSLVFPAESANSTDDTPYTPAAAVRQPSPHTLALTWHAHPISSPPSTQLAPAQLRQQQARRDARQMREIAQRWLAKPLPAGRTKPWQIAVLVRGRSHLTEILRAFQEPDNTGCSIPFRAVEIEPLNERQEILDLTALTRALLHPADRVAWLALLHGPCCGLSLAELHALTGADEPAFATHPVQRLMAERGDLLAEESILRMQRVWTTLESAAARRGQLSLSQLVERAWRSLGGDASLAASQLTNATCFFELLDEIEEPGGGIDLAVLDDRLQHLYAAAQTFAPGQPFVELLTMHKAKGLEWDVVLVPSLERSPGRTRSRLLAWSELDPTSDSAAMMLAPIHGKGQESHALNKWLHGLDSAREAAERKRLFYVGCTRAREELHLFAAPDLKTSGEPSLRNDSLLKAAWPAAEPHFAQLAADREEELPAPFVVDLAASGNATEPGAQAPGRPILQRLPLSFQPTERFASALARRLPYGDPASDSAAQKHFARPDGSFAARSFGNAVHTFIELLAARMASGTDAATLLAGLPLWSSRIAAVLRNDGLPPTTVARLTSDTTAALRNLLGDRDGQWLLAPHRGAYSEFALTAWDERTADTLRIDRIFYAGPTPHAAGEDTLWIVDFKTTPHGTVGLEDFLSSQRATYAPQLEAYARALSPAMPTQKVRLALYYPSIPRLLWWEPGLLDRTP